MCGCGCGSALANCANINFSQAYNALILIAPQFATVNPVTLANYESLYTLITCQVNQCLLGCNSALIFAFLLAHYLTISLNPSLGVNGGMKEGELSIDFNVSPDMSSLNLTPYGRSYIDLVKRTVIGSTVTNLPPQFGGIPGVCGAGMGCGGYGGFQGYGWSGW